MSVRFRASNEHAIVLGWSRPAVSSCRVVMVAERLKPPAEIRHALASFSTALNSVHSQPTVDEVLGYDDESF